MVFGISKWFKKKPEPESESKKAEPEQNWKCFARSIHEVKSDEDNDHRVYVYYYESDIGNRKVEYRSTTSVQLYNGPFYLGKVDPWVTKKIKTETFIKNLNKFLGKDFELYSIDE